MVFLPTKRQFVHALETVRVGPSLCILATVMAGLALPLSDVTPVRFGLTTVVVVLGFTNVNLYNYFTDIREDRRNERYNPVVNDDRSKILALYVALSALFVVVICWFWLSNVTLLLSVVGLAFGFLYSNRYVRLKERFLVKNLTIGIGYGMVLLIFRSGIQGTLTDLDLVIATYYAFFSITGSTTRDVFDIEGDSEAGVRTVPVRLGLSGTAVFLAVMAVLQVSTIVTAVAAGVIDSKYLTLVLAAPLLFKNPYYVWRTDLDALNPRGIPGIVASSSILVAIALLS